MPDRVTFEVLAASAELARAMGWSEPEEKDAEPFAPAPEIAAGLLETRFVRSKRDKWHIYRLVRSRGGWHHTDTTCPGWVGRGSCYHIEEANLETGLVPIEKGGVLALIDDIEDEEIVAAIGKSVQRSWVYEFPQGGTTVRGLSSTGVEQAARELAKQGEAIREIDVRIEYENEDEARFLAQAGRYAINNEGKEILLDVAIRAKRQPKFIKLKNGGTQPDEHWYEKGVTKAVRNAKLALLPEMAKTYILAEAVKAGRVRQVAAPAPSAPQRAVNAPQNRPTAAPAATNKPVGCKHGEQKYDEHGALWCINCGELLEEAAPVTEPAQAPLSV